MYPWWKTLTLPEGACVLWIGDTDDRWHELSLAVAYTYTIIINEHNVYVLFLLSVSEAATLVSPESFAASLPSDYRCSHHR